jgi:hypothetical protein
MFLKSFHAIPDCVQLLFLVVQVFVVVALEAVLRRYRHAVFDPAR